ncbi:MAG TPA: deoxyribonuclease IV [Solirubrobacteraceae bacterium]
MLIGAHVSPAGGPAKALARGEELGAKAIQIFNQSPRQWKPTVYSEETVAAYHEALPDSGVESLLIHAVYLLNPGSDDPDFREKTLTSLIASLRAGDALKADAVVLHAGSAKTGDVGEAIARAGELIGEALAESDRCPLHLENTAGAGGTLGRSFEELAALFDASGGGKRLGLCLDSCHLLASGYDVRTPATLDAVLEECDREVGLDRLGSLHFNDSKVTLGSNVDRHAVTGEGEIGLKGARVFLSEPRFDGLPCVLETLSDAREDVRLCWDLRKKGLAARKRAVKR